MATLRIAFWQAAGPGERYAPGAFDSWVGQVVSVTYTERLIGQGRIIAAEVEPDGLRVKITYEPLSLPLSGRDPVAVRDAVRSERQPDQMVTYSGLTWRARRDSNPQPSDP